MPRSIPPWDSKMSISLLTGWIIIITNGDGERTLCTLYETFFLLFFLNLILSERPKANGHSRSPNYVRIHRDIESHVVEGVTFQICATYVTWCMLGTPQRKQQRGLWWRQSDRSITEQWKSHAAACLLERGAWTVKAVIDWPITSRRHGENQSNVRTSKTRQH